MKEYEIDFNKAPTGTTHYSVSDRFVGAAGYWIKEISDTHMEAMRMGMESGEWRPFKKGGIWFPAKPLPNISLENK